MFDIFDIVLGQLSIGGRIEIRQRETAFGPGDERTVCVDGIGIAHLDPAWRSGRTVLLAHTAANQAATDGDGWRRFLAGLVVILEGHRGWRVACESDCDQYTVRRVVLSPADLASLLDSHRATRDSPIALDVTAP